MAYYLKATIDLHRILTYAYRRLAILAPYCPIVASNILIDVVVS